MGEKKPVWKTNGLTNMTGGQGLFKGVLGVKTSTVVDKDKTREDLRTGIVS